MNEDSSGLSLWGIMKQNGRAMRHNCKWLPFVYGAVIVIVSLMPLSAPGGTSLSGGSVFVIRWDYLLHFAMFVPFMVMIRVFLGVSFKRDVKVAVLWVAIGVVLAVGSEWLQRYVPYRSYNVNDIVANVVGVIIGSAVFFL